GATWNEPPYKFEAGTPMIAEAGGLGAAARYLMDLGMDNVRAHELSIMPTFLDALTNEEGVRVLGPLVPEQRSGPIAFTVDSVHPHDIGAMLDQHGVCVRVGHHCAKPLLKHLGLNSTARASLYVYNDVDDLEPLLDGIRHARDFFAR
ncbi:MAG: aminotransferase class V-fold PLP-dependent enzyme, partial [Nitriliruptorales bacterium]|nr:aminotransferase class V-fold PLP-dependent enzyme [Nitriliruptorales bacterium]